LRGLVGSRTVLARRRDRWLLRPPRAADAAWPGRRGEGALLPRASGNAPRRRRLSG